MAFSGLNDVDIRVPSKTSIIRDKYLVFDIPVTLVFFCDKCLGHLLLFHSPYDMVMGAQTAAILGRIQRAGCVRDRTGCNSCITN